MNGEMPRVRGLTLVEAWRGQRFSGLSVSKVSCPGFASRSIDMNRMTAFTLIELLVVITIIVVLLALLTPAVDRAIYSAELAVCEGKLHTISSGLVLYAYGNKKWYPNRP